MYTENRWRDAVLFTKACASNFIALSVPSVYVRLTRQTGRGAEIEDADSIALYFERCVEDYRTQLGLSPIAFEQFLTGKRVLEYGPGDVLGVALLLYGAGAATVECVDRFQLRQLSPKNAAVYRRLLERMPGHRRARAATAFMEPGNPESGFRSGAVEYRVTADGLAGRPRSFQLIVSRAVLEHVARLQATLTDVRLCLAPGGVSLHSVDLRSHNLDRYRPYDFLTWPDWAYQLMYSHKGFPNRLRPDAYRKAVAAAGLRARLMEPTGRVKLDQVKYIRPYLAKPFSRVSDEELSWLGFWMVIEAGGD